MVSSYIEYSTSSLMQTRLSVTYQKQKSSVYYDETARTIRILDGCEGRQKNPSRGSLSGITRLAERCQTMIARDGVFFLAYQIKAPQA